MKTIFEAQRLNRWKIARTSAEERVAKLRRLRDALLAKREELHKSLHDDFRKNPGEAWPWPPFLPSWPCPP